MGKSKKKRFGAPKPQPTGLPSVGQSEAELELSGELEQTASVLQGLVEKLQSPNVDVRECGCSTIAALVTRPADIQALLELNVLKILAPLTLDPSLEVRHRAIGALRNLSVDGGAEICGQMVAQDVLTPVVALIKQQYGGDGVMASLQNKKEEVAAVEVCTQAMYLLLNLCESSSLAVSIFNKENLLSVMAPCLTSENVQLQLAAAQCLHTVTEENPELIASARQTDLYAVLHKIMTPSSSSSTSESSESLLIRTLSAGILVNLEAGKMSSAHGDFVSGVVTSVSDVLSVDIMEMLQKVEQNCRAGDKGDDKTLMSSDLKMDDKMEEEQGNNKCDVMMDENADKSGEEKMDYKGDNDKVDKNVSKAPEKAAEDEETEPEEKFVQDVTHVLTAQRIGLEILTNLCCSEDDEWEDQDLSESSSSDDLPDAAMEDMVPDNGQTTSLCIPTEVHAAFVSSGVVSKVLQAAQPLEEGALQSLRTIPKGKSIVKTYAGRQTDALLCINNLVSSLEEETLGGAERLYTIWQGLTGLAQSQHSITDLALLAAVTSAMRAVIEKLAETQADKFSAVTAADLKFLFEMGLGCQESEIRVNAIRVVSTVGCMLARITQPHPSLKDIGQFLLSVTRSDLELWVVAEALDAIFDVFGEDHVDPIVQELNLVETLKVISPGLKAKIHSSRKSLGDHYPVIATARTNLARFIKYKSQPH